MPLLTVITVNYNDADGLRRTMESVLGQHGVELEYIVIDGGSTDGSVDVIQAYADKGISYWVSEKDGGIYPAMNKGVRWAHGTYVNFMNAGDVYYSDDTLAQVTGQLDADVVAGSHVMDGVVKHPKSQLSMADLFTDALNHQSSFIRLELLRQHPYREDFRIVSDWIFTVEMLVSRHASLRVIDSVIAVYDSTGISNTRAAERDAERQRFLQTFLPPLIYSDYQQWMAWRRCELYPHLASVGKLRYGCQRIIARLVMMLTKILKWL